MERLQAGELPPSMADGMAKEAAWPVFAGLMARAAPWVTATWGAQTAWPFLDAMTGGPGRRNFDNTVTDRFVSAIKAGQLPPDMAEKLPTHLRVLAMLDPAGAYDAHAKDYAAKFEAGENPIPAYSGPAYSMDHPFRHEGERAAAMSAERKAVHAYQEDVTAAMVPEVGKMRSAIDKLFAPVGSPAPESPGGEGLKGLALNLRDMNRRIRGVTTSVADPVGGPIAASVNAGGPGKWFDSVKEDVSGRVGAAGDLVKGYQEYILPNYLEMRPEMADSLNVGQHVFNPAKWFGEQGLHKSVPGFLHGSAGLVQSIGGAKNIISETVQRDHPEVVQQIGSGLVAGVGSKVHDGASDNLLYSGLRAIQGQKQPEGYGSFQDHASSLLDTKGKELGKWWDTFSNAPGQGLQNAWGNNWGKAGLIGGGLAAGAGIASYMGNAGKRRDRERMARMRAMTGAGRVNRYGTIDEF